MLVGMAAMSASRCTDNALCRVLCDGELTRESSSAVHTQ